MGYPLNALNALRHVSSSRLSREIVFASLYLAALGLATLLMFAKNQLEAASGGGGACRAGGRVLHGPDLYPYVGCHRQHINTLVLFIGSVGIIGSACVAVGAPSGLTCARRL